MTGDYVGNELDLFSSAHRWKAYWSTVLAPYIGRRVVDVGAGLGATARLFAGREFERYLALEPDAALASRIHGAAVSGELPAGLETRAGTIAALGKEERFDTALYIDVLEHIEADRHELAAVARHIEPGGRIIVLSPAHAFLYSAFDKAIGHVRRYDAAGLRAIAPPGTHVERVFYLDSVGMAASLANRLLLKSTLPTPGQIALWDRGMVPFSRWLDRVTFHRLGKTVVAIYRRDPQEARP
jgi:SAM-dependent methyltransferase